MRVGLIPAVALLVLGTAVATAPAASASSPVSDPASLVNPLIGTSGKVDDFPGADVPFGMVQWSPDTTSRPAGGGYDYADSAVTGFSVTHISGPGCASAGDLPVLPVSGALPSSPGAATLPLDHTQEQAQVGDYRLSAGGISTELTATARTGLARFVFPAGQPANLLLKLSSSAAGTTATQFQVVSPTEVTGSVTSGHFCGAKNSYQLFFDMQFDQPMTASSTWANGTSTTGPGGAALTFGATTVQAKVGISYVGIAGATANLTHEDPGWNLAATVTAAHSSWNTMLSRIGISGGTADEQTIFYTALYHSLLHPNIYSDVDGSYEGFDNTVHTTPSGRIEYANISGWDVYRSQIQLISMVAPHQAGDLVRSMLDEYDQTGALPRWTLYNSETDVMLGDPSDAIIADAYAFGARNFDTQHALQAMIHQATTTGPIRPGLQQYESDGYLPSDVGYPCCGLVGVVSMQLEYGIDDHAIASLAGSLGDTADAQTFAARANSWQDIADPATGYLQPKLADGQFAAGFAPGQNPGYVQGNAYRYTPMVPYDLRGIIAATGGSAAWVARLDRLTGAIGTSPVPATAGDFGNEPSLDIPWEYDYAGAPWKTQASVRSIEQQLYTTQPAGMAGNDDLGELSSWYVWAALGIYPITPGTADLALGSPLFDSATVTLPTGHTLTIAATGAADASPYVQGMTVNGATWTKPYLTSTATNAGGTVDVVLGPQADTTWGAASVPPSDATGLLPALGYSTSTALTPAPGATMPVTIGARNLFGTAQTVSWTATSSNGLSVTPTSGSLTLNPGKATTTTVAVTAPTAPGSYQVRVAFTTAAGTALPPVVVGVTVVQPGDADLSAVVDNVGAATDGVTGGNFDHDGYAYSAQALAAQGVTPGQTLTVGGLTYTWPSGTSDNGGSDNVVTAGQVVPLTPPAGATRIGVLGAATNATPGASGTATVTYTDGTTSTSTLAFGDWTLVGGHVSGPQYGNTVAVTMPYRDTSAGVATRTPAYVFEADVPLTAGETVASIRLPAAPATGQLHVFAVAVG